mmetsp:Transcript_58402/g.125492  ORF Transcript_58402/g.125492 Transcript_58402/m.125492 type:complete len:144 (-) Transcript_58402:98-529(-)
MPRETSYSSMAAGKYDWFDDTIGVAAAAPVVSETITQYSWTDGDGVVSIYIQLDGLDDVSDHALLCDSGPRNVSLTILGIGVPPKRRRFALAGLPHDIEGMQLVRKRGKHTVVLKLTKKEVRSWRSLSGGVLSGVHSNIDDDG